jgi:ferredoxin-NADP reductase
MIGSFADASHLVPNAFSSYLIRQESAALQTGSFYFEKPQGFQFTAGQFIDLTLPLVDVPDRDRIHTFSISSAPYEDHLAITTRLRDSPFKVALRRLTQDDVVEIEGPYGEFVLSPDVARPVAFVIGGVGITPAISIIKQAARNSELVGIYLFYFNRRQAEAPFLAELTRLQSQHPGFHLIAAMTDEPSWNGEKELVSIAMIRRYLDPSSTSFFTSGPPGMVTAVRELLTSNGVRKDRVFYENFAGY